ncbi:hypothetical protein [Sediminibacillus albus]|uniref:Permuted papain-like amidase enzyme, YaeF/YiiX, C92 family n=1 Tax=Sediminibacillus albus TaxID=407036 RepID=A0A1G8ZWQ6_9BACI|nr:hypothetical protein [Sediminibacillus albus]SDK19546.1 hypothetical protein SAMN05216243_2270 [Sediminibacillus albus]
MTNLFQLTQMEDIIKVETTLASQGFVYYSYIDQSLHAIHLKGRRFYLDTGGLRNGPHQLLIVAYDWQTGSLISGSHYHFSVHAGNYRERTFLPGDILVASDNVNQAKTGYVGHSALVVDKDHVIESPGLHPAIRKDTIQQFLVKHPVHAHFRPKSTQAGQAAAGYAEQYLNEFKEKGQGSPVFSFSLSSSLDDPWEYIYCSKLIWLSYYYGADYKLENDFLWFSPEDLYNNLGDSEDFELVYKHPDVKFVFNT